MVEWLTDEADEVEPAVYEKKRYPFSWSEARIRAEAEKDGLPASTIDHILAARSSSLK